MSYVSDIMSVLLSFPMLILSVDLEKIEEIF